MSEFDPYTEWFRIPAGKRPPDHYQLLGINRFEDDPGVIEAATNRRVRFLQDVAAGDFVDQSQQLLNEVAAARRCLLHSEKKQAYDKKLQTRRRRIEAPAKQSAEQLVPERARHNEPLITVHSHQQGKPGTSAARPTSDSGAKPVKVSGKRKRLTNNELSVRVLLVVGTVAALMFLLVDLGDRSTPDLDQPALLRIEWPLSERQGAEMLVDGHLHPIPAAADFQVPLTLGTHDVIFRRLGHEDIEDEFDFGRQPIRVRLEWQPE